MGKIKLPFKTSNNLKLCETRKPLHAVFEQTTMVKNMYSHRWVLEHLSPNLALALATDV